MSTVCHLAAIHYFSKTIEYIGVQLNPSEDLYQNIKFTITFILLFHTL